MKPERNANPLADPRAARLLERLRALIATVAATAEPLHTPPDRGRLTLDTARMLHALHQQEHAQAEAILRELSAWAFLQQDYRSFSVYLICYERKRYRRYDEIGQLVYLDTYRSPYYADLLHVYRLDVVGSQTERPFPPAWERAVDADRNLYAWRYADELGGLELTDALLGQLGAAGQQAVIMVQEVLVECE